jgi:ParB/Sulfiredoxin domain
MKAKRSQLQPELVHVQVWPLARISPAPENDDIYKPIALDSPDISDLARSIEEHGVQEPLLVSTDGYVISGHRRRVAAILAGLTEVPVRVYPVSREPCFNDLVVSDNNLTLFGS